MALHRRQLLAALGTGAAATPSHEIENPLSDPVVADGTLYVATGNTLVALRDG